MDVNGQLFFSSVALQKQSPVQTVRTLWTKQKEPNEMPRLSTKIYWTHRKNIFDTRNSNSSSGCAEHTCAAIMVTVDVVKTGKKGNRLAQISHL
jgi:hypothetical protein